MSDIKILKPGVPGEIVRDPRTREPLPDDGKAINLSGKDGSFWRRRLSDGSVVEVSPKNSSKTVEAPKPAETSKGKE